MSGKLCFGFSGLACKAGCLLAEVLTFDCFRINVPESKSRRSIPLRRIDWQNARQVALHEAITLNCKAVIGGGTGRADLLSELRRLTEELLAETTIQDGTTLEFTARFGHPNNQTSGLEQRYPAPAANAIRAAQTSFCRVPAGR